MHSKLTFIGDLNFIKLFTELKSVFDFTFNVQDIDQFKVPDKESIYILLEENSHKINFTEKQKIIILKNRVLNEDNNRYIQIPCSIDKLNKQILNHLSSNIYKHNSQILVGGYTLDINSRTLTKNNNQTKLTEKEIKLITLLQKTKIPIKKEKLIKLIWNYSSESDTHTLETHIYRLRKKMLETFNDENFIKNNNSGYYL